MVPVGVNIYTAQMDFPLTENLVRLAAEGAALGSPLFLVQGEFFYPWRFGSILTLRVPETMKVASYGRIVFGASAVLYGVIGLMWYDAETWQTLKQIWRLPFGTVIGGCLMILQIAGGIAIQFPRTVRLGAIVLCVVYLSFSLACIPDIINSTSLYERYGGSFFQQLSLLGGAIALYSTTQTSAAGAVVFRRLARIGLGVCAISFAFSQVLYRRDTAELVPKWIPPNQMFWVILTTSAFALAAIAILLNCQARLATHLMTLMLALFGVLVWVPSLAAYPKMHLNWSESALTFLITGAVWMVADFAV